MACYAGITTDLDRRYNEHLRTFPTLRNWQRFGPFRSRAAVQQWEDQQTGCRHHGVVADPANGLPWYGYRFEH